MTVSRAPPRDFQWKSPYCSPPYLFKFRTSPFREALFAPSYPIVQSHKYSHPNDYSQCAHSAKLPQGLVREVVLGDDGLSEDHLEGRPDASGRYFFEALRLLDRLVGESLLVGNEGFSSWLAVWRCG